MKKHICLLLLMVLGLSLFPIQAMSTGETTSSNMNLTIPGVGVTSGPTWAEDINASLNLIDAHDHSSGKGVQVTPSGLNINSALSCGLQNLTSVRSVRFNPYASSGTFSAGASDIGALYEISPDLYYLDGNGNSIRLTIGGTINSATGSISGMGGYPNASAAYSGTTGTFVWQQAVSTAAHMDMADAIIRYAGSYPTPAGNYIALQAPSSLATGYAFTLPATTPAASGAWLTSSTAGTISYTNTDNSSVEISSATLRVKAGGITTAMMASGAAAGNIGAGAITTTMLADASVTQAKRAALTSSISSAGGITTSSTSYVSVTNLSVTITSTGRPMWIGMVADGTATAAVFGNTGAYTSYVEILDGATALSIQQNTCDAAQCDIPVSAVSHIQLAPVAGSRTYSVSIRTSNASGSAYVADAKLLAYEL